MKTYDIDGMTCGGCVSAVTRALEKAGYAAAVDLETHTVRIDGEPDDTTVVAAITKAGFGAKRKQA